MIVGNPEISFQPKKTESFCVWKDLHEDWAELVSQLVCLLPSQRYSKCLLQYRLFFSNSLLCFYVCTLVIYVNIQRVWNNVAELPDSILTDGCFYTKLYSALQALMEVQLWYRALMKIAKTSTNQSPSTAQACVFSIANQCWSSVPPGKWISLTTTLLCTLWISL